MNSSIQNEVWQVAVGGQTYEAPLAELPMWIDEGSLQPADLVRKGNLRWIEARKVPALIPFFNAREKGEPMPVVQTVTNAEIQPFDAANSPPSTVGAIPENPLPAPQAAPFAGELSAEAALTGDPVVGMCVNHQDRPTTYICSSCELEFCKVCPSSYGGNVRICPDCGSMCRSTAETKNQADGRRAGGSIDAGSFGFGDFSEALAYPFRFKPSLIFGGIIFVFLSIGQSAASIGGIFLIAAALVCVLLTNMLVFGVRANVIDNFTQGNLEADFMPSFDDFSIWSDVVHPFFLSIGVYISSFGPFFLVALIGGYMIASAAGEQMKKFDAELTSVPGTQFYAPDRTAEQSKEVRELLAKVKQQNSGRTTEQTRTADPAGSAVSANSAPEPSATEADQEKAKMDQLLQEIRAKQIEQAAPAPAADKAQQYTAVLAGVMHLAAPLVVIGMIAFLWGAFYYPAACAVAGYTRSFTATINPLVGLDTIRRLGFDYAKILLMAFLLLLLAGVIGFIFELLLSPLNLPRIGNVPAMVLGGFATFYFSVVFSCILGFALFKSADRLKLYR